MELWSRDSRRIALRARYRRSLWDSNELLSTIGMLHQPVGAVLVSLLRRGGHLLVLNGLLLNEILLSLMLLVCLMCRMVHGLLHLIHACGVLGVEAVGDLALVDHVGSGLVAYLLMPKRAQTPWMVLVGRSVNHSIRE